MKITLEKEDLEALETALMNGIVRAVRLLAKEGFLAPLAGAIVEAGTAAAPGPGVAPAPVGLETETPPASHRPPYRPEWAKPFEPPPSVQGGPVEPPGPTRRADLPPAPRPTPQPPSQKRTRRSMAQICKTVKDRPQGFVTTDEVYSLIETTMPAQTLSAWIVKGEVPAVIVASYKPPTKGLPGRLMVDKKAIVVRENLRKMNSALAPARREQVPREESSSHVHRLD